jgi:hypothetical protein
LAARHGISTVVMEKILQFVSAEVVLTMAECSWSMFKLTSRRRAEDLRFHLYCFLRRHDGPHSELLVSLTLLP